MERTQIYLTTEEAAALDRIAAQRGVTRSHLIREAVDAAYVSPRLSQRDRLLATLDEFGAPWADREDIPDGETYVERIRTGFYAPLDAQYTRHRGGKPSERLS